MKTCRFPRSLRLALTIAAAAAIVWALFFPGGAKEDPLVVACGRDAGGVLLFSMEQEGFYVEVPEYEIIEVGDC